MAYAFIIVLNDYNIYIKYYKGTPNNTNARHGFTKVCLKKCGFTMLHAQEMQFYHGSCPKNMVLPKYMPKKHGITMVDAQKHGFTMVDAQKT